MRMNYVAMAAAATIALAGPAAAVQYRFDVFDPTVQQSGQPIDNNTYTFYLDASPGAPAHDASSFTVQGVITYSVTFSGGAKSNYTLIPSDITFYTDPTNNGVDGGLQTQFDSYFGPQLFTGTTAVPTFKTGSFTLDGGRSIAIAAVPEAAAWATMLAGFAMVGGALRTRRRGVAFT